MLMNKSCDQDSPFVGTDDGLFYFTVTEKIDTKFNTFLSGINHANQIVLKRTVGEQRWF